MNLSSVKPVLAEIAIELLDEPRLMSRNAVDEAHVLELITSIRANGFTSAVLVARVADRYEIIAGHHRLLAARRVGIGGLPALVYPSYLDGIEALQHTENALQKPAGAADQAVWYSELLALRPEDGTDGVAARIGESRDHVEGRLRLLAGCPRVFAALAAGEIAIGVAHELNKCTEDRHRYMLLDQAVRAGSTVGMVRTWIIEWKTIHAPASVNVPPMGSVAAGGPVLVDSYFVCRACGERDNTANMMPVNVHDYCLRGLIDARTGFFKSRADYLEFPATREAAVALVKRILDRFPELAESA